ncbi:aspartate/glutamate racemase family protein [Candidatus Woesearchaeota archaeon]|nr:aspartate/glutamate racemase family protein [Candidatus Woesearchaeota archaeon]
MKTIGLIGGMSWESTQEYYKLLNCGVKEKLGGLNSAKIILHSLNFEEIAKMQSVEDWKTLEKTMINSAQKLENAGADFVLICTNTMHKLADQVETAIKIPLIHIADATADSIKNKKITKVGLLGTKFTMEQAFYKDRLKEKHGIDVVIPTDSDRQIIHDVIYNELCLGEIREDSKKEYLRIINNLVKLGAQGIVLGCTEIPSLIKQDDVNSSIIIFDTTQIHANYALKQALE